MTFEGFKPTTKSADQLLKTEWALPRGLATDLSSNVCKTQPQVDEMPELRDTMKPGGCTYRSFAEPRDESWLVDRESKAPRALYQKALSEEVRVQTIQGGSFHGGGVIIGETPDKIVIATDNHVIDPSTEFEGAVKGNEKYSVTMPDGTVHQAKLEIAEPATDRAVISISKDDNLTGTYKVAKFYDEPKRQGSGMIYGFPYQSTTLYGAPTRFLGPIRLGHVYAHILPGENPNRTVLAMDGLMDSGDSGSGIKDKSGVTVALNEGWIASWTDRRSYGTPISRSEVFAWLSQIAAEAPRTQQEAEQQP